MDMSPGDSPVLALLLWDVSTSVLWVIYVFVSCYCISLVSIKQRSVLLKVMGLPVTSRSSYLNPIGAPSVRSVSSTVAERADFIGCGQKLTQACCPAGGGRLRLADISLQLSVNQNLTCPLLQLEFFQGDRIGIVNDCTSCSKQVLFMVHRLWALCELAGVMWCCRLQTVFLLTMHLFIPVRWTLLLLFLLSLLVLVHPIKGVEASIIWGTLQKKSL
ncbi:hypothetical protein GOODEAATRI_021319 [Goodea atripinnis]|uniref:ATP synthase F0 subunit 8 n=1 Tax=Goodea atripinnis TaxID=208336 RepID=A0ABV0PFS2_9TELE